MEGPTEHETDADDRSPITEAEHEIDDRSPITEAEHETDAEPENPPAPALRDALSAARKID